MYQLNNQNTVEILGKKVNVKFCHERYFAGKENCKSIQGGETKGYLLNIKGINVGHWFIE